MGYGGNLARKDYSRIPLNAPVNRNNKDSEEGLGTDLPVLKELLQATRKLKYPITTGGILCWDVRLARILGDSGCVAVRWKNKREGQGHQEIERAYQCDLHFLYISGACGVEPLGAPGMMSPNKRLM
jgi:hypothetical protein